MAKGDRKTEQGLARQVEKEVKIMREEKAFWKEKGNKNLDPRTLEPIETEPKAVTHVTFSKGGTEHEQTYKDGEFIETSEITYDKPLRKEPADSRED